jgi:hypothetical protein
MARHRLLARSDWGFLGKASGKVKEGGISNLRVPIYFAQLSVIVTGCNRGQNDEAYKRLSFSNG